MGQQVAGAGQIDIRCTPWRWLRTRVERLRAPIDFAPVGLDHEPTSHPAEGSFPALARQPAPVWRGTTPQSARCPVKSPR